MPFELKAPGGLWLLGLLAPLLLLYILKIRRERRVVSSTWLWNFAGRDLLAQHPFRRLVAQIPLVLELLALALLALALGRPATRGGQIGGEHVAIVVDTSASMGAIDAAGRSRMALAQDAARGVVRALGASTEAVVIAAGRDARVVSTMDRDRKRLLSSIDQLRAADVEGRLGRAIATATTQLRPYGGRVRVVVISDGALAERDALANTALPLDFIRVGSPVENAAIIRLSIAGGIDPKTQHSEVEAFALVANFGTAPRTLYVSLRQRNVDEPLASRRIDLAPGERAPVLLGFEPAPGDAGTGLIVELSPHDALMADDRAFGRVPAGATLPVVLAPAKANPWVTRALQADPNVELLGASLDALASAGIPDDALVVLDGACPANVPGGDLLVLNPPQGACRTAVVGPVATHPIVTSWAEVDPRLRFLSLDGLEVLKASRLEPDSPQSALVRSSAGCLIADISTPGQSGTLVGFDVGESNWPLKASFVLFLRNVVELARSHRSRGLDAPARTGEPLSLRVPLDVTEVETENPDGARQRRSARAGVAVLPDLPSAGFYYSNWKGSRPGSTLVAANLASERESDLRAEALLGPHGRPLPVRFGQDAADAVREWAWLLAALALVLILLDVLWITRRPRIKPLGARPALPERPGQVRA